MPLFLPTPCQTCGTGHPWPAEARFCRNCGRPAHWSETPAGRRRVAVLAAVGILLAVGLVSLGLFVATQSRTAVATVRSTPARPVSPPKTTPPPPPPVAVPPVAGPSIPPLPATVPQVPATPPADVPAPAAPVLPPADPVPASVPARPGDTDLVALPLSAYAGGPSGDRLTVHGVGVGVAASAVPAALVAERSADHLRDVGGNVYDVTDGRIAQVHVREAAVLDRMPIDGTHALLARFGDPDRPPQDVGAQTFVLAYPERGVDVRWDDGVQRLDEVTLYRPRPRR